MSGENPERNADRNAGDLGRFKSPDTKARALANLKPPIQLGSTGLPGAGRPKRDAELHQELLRALNAKVPGDRERRTLGFAGHGRCNISEQQRSACAVAAAQGATGARRGVAAVPAPAASTGGLRAHLLEKHRLAQ